jgi:hypothetical protein
MDYFAPSKTVRNSISLPEGARFRSVELARLAGSPTLEFFIPTLEPDVKAFWLPLASRKVRRQGRLVFAPVAPLN